MASQSQVNALDYLPAAQRSAIRAGTSRYDCTSALQRAIDDAALAGLPLVLPGGVYGTRDLRVPAVPFALHAEGRATLRALAGTGTLLAFDADISRAGHKVVRGLRLDGAAQPNVIGLSTGAGDAATLYVQLHGVWAERCAVGFHLYGAMEHLLSGCTAIGNGVGFRLTQSPTGGGGNSNTFVRCAAQSNAVGFFCRRDSPFPFQNNAFVSCISQSNSVCGVAVIGGTGFVLSNHHLEGNATATAPLVVDGATVDVCSVLADGAGLALRDTEVGEATTPTGICARNGARVILDNAGGYGLTSGRFFDGDATSVMILQSESGWTDRLSGPVGAWGRMTGRTALWGPPLVLESRVITNRYPEDPLTPTIANAVGLVSSGTEHDDTWGSVSVARFATQPGDSATHRFTLNVDPAPVLTGDQWVVSLLVRADRPCTLTLSVQNGSFLVSPVPVGTSWQRVVLRFTATSDQAPGIILYVWPVEATGPTVSLTRFQVVKAPVGEDPEPLAQIIALGLFDPIRRVEHAAAQPTTGTFRAGDLVWNTAPAELGPAGQRYVLQGWRRLTRGSAHVAGVDWVELRAATGR